MFYISESCCMSAFTIKFYIFGSHLIFIFSSHLFFYAEF